MIQIAYHRTKYKSRNRLKMKKDHQRIPKLVKGEQGEQQSKVKKKTANNKRLVKNRSAR